MNSIRVALLITACISLPLYAMEKQTTAQQQSLVHKFTKMQLRDIQNLYTTTYENLEEITRDNLNAAPSLLKILEHTDHLKKQGINEDHLTKFAFTQEAWLQDKLRNQMQPPYNGPHYIAALFKRIKQYNDYIAKTKRTTPTLKEYSVHTTNERIKVAVNTASSFGLYIDTTLNPIADTVAVQKFHELINDIYTMRCENPTTITEIANLLYSTISTDL